MCTGNEIKSTPGDATNCSADPPCDGITSVPNAEHSACGESRLIVIFRRIFGLLDDFRYKTSQEEEIG